ncbi:type I-F CRISPR-associated protein Csy3 [Pectobacterium brasiliense]|uniref:type I-F CRISPR-associated protein Csy3 n=1 Tax=Pectobacterium brasiliense TaxID=180957 RepID=UPI00057E5DC4|nr:type I-F CRISPR-associated protein Csy3 [Pectobacterium brasiliense]APS31417.1 CRISPR-associated protein Cas5 [Pectobacterium brasiliense]KHT05263.1 CRISPR-associated protein Cas5 [Pectobacterium brasiliense]MBN3096230.1 type I-F CRISPR-associated protein Csy3 [Pectobacterium brasiliense]MBN3102695.1 type I-F CRISPR-associated protein Csy3 [Pectobacterium brasiliense]MBN3166576.1 type I-F CRISPR-associated protein Csy3 [Pectobacterium brasiliense]
MAKTTIVLAFERKLSSSDAVMYAGNWAQQDNWTPIAIQEKSVRGTISHRLKNPLTSDPGKSDSSIDNANLQKIDAAALPFNADTLKIVFTLRVLGNLAHPSVCNDQDYQTKLGNIITEYAQEQGFSTLTARYAENIANGRFLWRNRVGAEAIRVVVTTGEQRWEFNGEDYSLRAFSQPTGDLAALAQAIEQGLEGDSSALFTVEAYVQLGNGQEVFPSQELVQDNESSNSKKSKKSKFLYQVNDVAAIHSQKIGNALRTIDDWYPAADEAGPIAVEPYGSVTNRGKAYRQPRDKMDFYTLLDKWVLKGDAPELEQQHYVIAMLIRGGVFSEKGE